MLKKDSVSYSKLVCHYLCPPQESLTGSNPRAISSVNMKV